MLKNRQKTCPIRNGTVSMCLLWCCVLFSYVCSLGANAFESHSLSPHKKQHCELTRQSCRNSTSCVPILHEKGHAEKQLDQKNRRRNLKDGSHNAYGSDAIMPPWRIVFLIQSGNSRHCIFGNAVHLPDGCAFHIFVRAGPVA